MSTESIAQVPVDRRVSLLRADGIGDNIPPTLTIEVHEQISGLRTLDESRQLHARQAEMLANALLASLPGGTVDCLL